MPRIKPYILAGGRSSRMGQDKAMLPLAGRTLLGRAVDTLHGIPGLRGDSGEVRVTVVGERQQLEGADRAIADRHPLRGPLGGMEAALTDLREGAEADWALFVPVDMPFLPAGLIAALLAEWTEAVSLGGLVCYVVADGRPQPLVSLLHHTLHPFIARALTAGQLKVTPVLQSGAAILASQYAGGIGFRISAVRETLIVAGEPLFHSTAWTPSRTEMRSRHLWFSNVNTKEDFLEAEIFLSPAGRS